jgi:hypothetical protein
MERKEQSSRVGCLSGRASDSGAARGIRAEGSDYFESASTCTAVPYASTSVTPCITSFAS